MRRLIVGFMLASLGGATQASEVHVAACTAVWSVTLMRDGVPIRGADFCRGGRAGLALPDLENGATDTLGWIAIETDAAAATLVVRDSETGPIRARGTVRLDTTAPQPLDADGTGKLSLAFTPLDLVQPVQVNAENATVGEVLVALRDRAGVDLRGDLTSAERLTVRLAASPLDSVLSILTDVGGYRVLTDADGTRRLGTPRDASRLQELRRQFEAAASQGGDREAERHILEDIRGLVRVRSKEDVPPDARYELGLLADAYRRDARYADQVEIRRELLRIEQRYDARPDSRAVAIARLDLAAALDLVAGTTAEARSLVELASPMAEQGLTEGGAEAALHAETLARHGRSALALRHLEANYRSCADDDALVWLLETEHLHFLLLRNHIDAGRAPDVDRLLGDWQRCVEGQPFPAQAIRISSALEDNERGRYADAARTFEAILLRIAKPADMDAEELADLHQRALFASLGAGHWRRASALLDVLQASQAQRPEALKFQHQRERQVLRALAGAAQGPPTAADRTLADRLARTKGRATAEAALILDFQVFALTLLTERPPAHPDRDGSIALRESAFVLSPVVDGHPALANDPNALLRALSDLRRAGGADSAAITQRERELRRLRDLVARAWSADGPPR